MTRTIPHGCRALGAACALALIALGGADAQARLGDLDPSFDGDGVALPDVGPVGAAGAELEDVIARADGRIVGVGWVSNPAGLAEPLLVQQTDGGGPDATFGTSGPGLTRVASTASSTELHGAALDNSGRVLAAGGQAPSSGAQPLPVALRFSSSGTPDAGFLGVIGAIRGESRAIAPLADGTTLVAGWRGAIGQEALFVAKLTPGGALDTSGFGGGDGIADVLGSGARGEAMAVDTAGRIVVAGWIPFVLGNQTVQQPVIARLTSSGELDASFGSGGVANAAATNPDGAAVGELHAVRIDGAGRIVAAGLSGRHAFVTRRLDSGTADASFGAGGAKFGTLPTSAAVSALAIDGARTIVAGRISGSAPEQLLLGSLDGAGTPEAALGGAPPGWRAFASPTTGGIEAIGAALGPGGVVYTAGALQAINEPPRPLLTRHLPNAVPAAALGGPAQVAAGAPATFDAGGSSDPEGEPLRYAFDLDGNGTFEHDAGDAPFATRSFPAPGTFAVGVRVTDPRGASGVAARTIVVTATAVPPPRPILGKQGVAKVLRGIVRIRLPGTRRFVRLDGLTAIPNGTEIDARRGRVLITVVRNRKGKLDSARFYAGRFIFRQAKGPRPVTSLRLSGGTRKACGAKVASIAAAGGGKKRVRRLWGDGRGRFRTRGRYGAATVRGTKWLTRDRCDGTLVRVVRGKVSVEDLGTPPTSRAPAPAPGGGEDGGGRKTIVKAGERTLVPAGRGR